MSDFYLSNVRLSFPKLIEPSAPQGFETKKFGADFLMPLNHPDYDGLMKQIGVLATEKWKGQANAVLAMIQKDRRLRCFGTGDEKIDKKTMKPYVGYDDMFYIAGSSPESDPPKMVTPEGDVIDNDNTLQRQAAARKLYGGCYVNAVVNLWIQDNQFGRAVRCKVIAVQFAKDGDAFGEGEKDVSSMFKPVTTSAGTTVPSFFN